jgi:hypothetical protein
MNKFLFFLLIRCFIFFKASSSFFSLSSSSFLKSLLHYSVSHHSLLKLSVASSFLSAPVKLILKHLYFLNNLVYIPLFFYKPVIIIMPVCHDFCLFIVNVHYLLHYIVKISVGCCSKKKSCCLMIIKSL